MAWLSLFMRMLSQHEKHWVKFGLTPDECLTGRIEAKRLVEILSRPSVVITQCHDDSNSHGEYTFLSFVTFDKQGRPQRRMCLYGKGESYSACRQEDWFNISDEDISYPQGGFYTADPDKPYIVAIPGPWRYRNNPPTTRNEWKALSEGGKVYGGEDKPSFYNRYTTTVDWYSKKEILDMLIHHASSARTYRETIQAADNSRSKAYAFMEENFGPDPDAITTDLEDHPSLEALFS